MYSVQFGAITRMVFTNPPQIDWHAVYARKDPKSLAVARQQDKAARDAFQKVIDAHLSDLKATHSGTADYFASALPMGLTGDRVLLIDSPDWETYAIDVFKARQGFLSDLDGKLARGEESTPASRAQAPVPPVYNWSRRPFDDVSGDAVYSDQSLGAEAEVRRRYWQKATRTIEVTV